MYRIVSQSLCISVAQTTPVAGDVERNLAEHLQLADVAASEGAQLLLFPELSLTGYELGHAQSSAFAETDAWLEPLKTRARDGSITLVVGAPIRLSRGLRIGAFIIHPQGDVLIYTKQRLGAFGPTAKVDGIVPPREDSVFSPGECNPQIDIGGQPAALAICADIGDRSHVARAAQRGAKVYLASMFVIPSDFDSDEPRLAGYAREHAMVVAMSNYGAPSGGLAAAGRSSIWSERGELLVRLGAAGSGIAVASRSFAGWRTKTVPVAV